MTRNVPASTGTTFWRPPKSSIWAEPRRSIRKADHQEEGPGREAVIEHVERRALDGRLAEREDPQHHETEVRDRGVGDEP